MKRIECMKCKMRFEGDDFASISHKYNLEKIGIHYLCVNCRDKPKRVIRPRTARNREVIYGNQE